MTVIRPCGLLASDTPSNAPRVHGVWHNECMSETTDLIELARLVTEGTARRIRTAAGLTIKSVAADLGVAASTVSRWETGRVPPSRDHAVAWLELLRKIQAAQEGMSTSG